MTDTTIIVAAAKKLANRPFSSAFHADADSVLEYVSQNAGDFERFNEHNREDWEKTGADFLDYEPGEEEDWRADHTAHFHLSLFVTFLAREWAEESAQDIALGRCNAASLKNLIENATQEFVSAWADAREGR